MDTLHVNGDAMQGENIADLGGVLLGPDALKKTDAFKKKEKIAGFTPLQRYFAGCARVGFTLKEKRNSPTR